ncbi:MAG: LPS-assembly protein LptD [Treponema sp.]|nr:LPS-assembly protein LptD [Treponema sp.]
MKNIKLVCLFSFLFSILLTYLNAQEEIPSLEHTQEEYTGPEYSLEDLPDSEFEFELEDIPEPVRVQVLTPEQNRIQMEIRTSSLTELADWARRLGLPESGTSTDLAGRIRNYYEIMEQPVYEDEDGRKIITIESARKTEYFKIETVDEEYARLSGDVIITLKDGEATHRIQAWDILFNRTRNIITASGGVVYIKEEGDTIETFRGDSITVNIDNWSSIFLGGISERSLQNEDTTYMFAGTVISRDDEDVTILNKAIISSGDNEESYWSIHASRVWLLPGSDFAILNAVLKVGEIPVLYIPFFYYPADEIIFHPVFGFRTREGNYIQTTTYILGRPRASSSTQSSLTRILGSSQDMERVREGMFLRSTGKKETNPSETSLVAMLDYYSNLGTYIGADLDLPARGIFGALKFSLGIGLTRTIVPVGNTYTAFFPDYDGTTDWNSSNLFSMNVPFRYRLINTGSISGRFGSFRWNMPMYSDPFVDSDFLNRATEMDWVNMIQQGAGAFEAEQTFQNASRNYQWDFSGTVNFNFPTVEPFISNISIGSISSVINFHSSDIIITDRNDIGFYSPSNEYFRPISATLYSVSGTISGTPLTLGRNTVSDQSISTEETELPESIRNIGTPRSPFPQAEQSEPPQRRPSDELVPPVLTQTFRLPQDNRGVNLSVGYSITPSSLARLNFDTSKWPTYSDVDWGDISFVLSNYAADAGTTVNFNHNEGLFSSSFTYSGRGIWWQYNYLDEDTGGRDGYDLNGDPDPARISNVIQQEYNNSNFSTNYSFSTNLSPLYQNEIFRGTGLTYSLAGHAISSHFIGTASDPEWEIIYGDWSKDGRKGISTHSLSANLAASILGKTQSFTVTSTLPPRDPDLSLSSSINIWITTTTARMGIQFPGDPEKQKLGDVSISNNVNFNPFGSLSNNLTIKTEEGVVSNLSSSLNLTKWGFRASYTAIRRRDVLFNPNTGSWFTDMDSEETLQSENLRMDYSISRRWDGLLRNRLNFGITSSSNLTFNLREYTQSSFNFSLSFDIGVSNFLSLSLRTNSKNQRIYQYFRNFPFFNDVDIDLPPGSQTNIFLDLVNSFRFDNEALRRSSGFKTDGFSLTATHYLGDWNAILTWNMATSNRYGRPEMNSTMDFLVQWNPISEIKTNIGYNKLDEPTWRIRD